MSLINAFIAGACTVTVLSGPSSTTLWSGTLGLSASSSPFTDTASGNSLGVSVDADGNVSLNVLSGSGSLLQYYSLNVAPQYSFTGGLSAADITINNATTGTAARTTNTVVDLTGSASAWTPDPAAPDDDSPIYIGVYQGGSF